MKNATVISIQDMIRQPYCWPGGYTKRLIMADGEILCAECAKSNYRLISNSTRHAMRDGWQAEGVDILWEDPDNYCAHCNNAMPTEYGDPDSDMAA